MPRHRETEIIVEKLSYLNSTVNINFIKKDIAPVETENKICLLLNWLRSDWINRIAGYFLNQRPNTYYASLDNESKIQDLVFILATSIFPDLHFENPQSKNIGALTSTRIDFSSQNDFLFIEVKHASDKHQAQKIEREISEDIVKYGKSKNFFYLIFFIYCHNYHFPNAKDFERSFTSKQIISTHPINTYCIIKP